MAATFIVTIIMALFDFKIVAASLQFFDVWLYIVCFVFEAISWILTAKMNFFYLFELEIQPPTRPTRTPEGGMAYKETEGKWL